MHMSEAAKPNLTSGTRMRGLLTPLSLLCQPLCRETLYGWRSTITCAHADILGALASTKRSTLSASAKMNPKKQTVIAKS
jgi:hypothetical protein